MSYSIIGPDGKRRPLDDVHDEIDRQAEADVAERKASGAPVLPFPTTAPDTSGPETFQSIWSVEAEARPKPLIPALAWAGSVSLLASAPKLGKTSLLASGISAWMAQRPFLGEQPGEVGTCLYVSEMAVAVLRAWLERYGCPQDAPIFAASSLSVDAIVAEALKRRPKLIVVDSLTDVAAASGSANLWSAGEVRRLLAPLRTLGDCAISVVHHVRKSDGAGRDSGDVAAFVDQNISFDPGFPFGADAPPAGPRRLRFFGRWPEPTRALAFDPQRGYELAANSTPGGGDGGGGEEPATVVAPAGNLLDEKVSGYLMKNPGSTGRQIRSALGCQWRPLQASLARLAAAGSIGCEAGPRSAKLWSVTTGLTGLRPQDPMFKPVKTSQTRRSGREGTPDEKPDATPDVNGEGARDMARDMTTGSSGLNRPIGSEPDDGTVDGGPLDPPHLEVRCIGGCRPGSISLWNYEVESAGELWTHQTPEGMREYTRIRRRDGAPVERDDRNPWMMGGCCGSSHARADHPQVGVPLGGVPESGTKARGNDPADS